MENFILYNRINDGIENHWYLTSFLRLPAYIHTYINIYVCECTFTASQAAETRRYFNDWILMLTQLILYAITCPFFILFYFLFWKGQKGNIFLSLIHLKGIFFYRSDWLCSNSFVCLKDGSKKIVLKRAGKLVKRLQTT